MSNSGKKRARDTDIIKPISRNETSLMHVPFGTFEGTSIYQNRLHPGETYEDGHVSIHNLVLEECTAALVTTFAFEPVADQTWLESIFSPQITHVTFVAHNAHGPVIGHARLDHLYSTIPNWLLLQCKPHTGGCFHPKLLLFRNPKGLRVVVSGNNFFQQQWHVDRDLLWVQDFYTATTMSVGYYGGEFQATLETFVQDVTKCSSVRDQCLMNQRIEALLRGIDFSPAQGRLVISFPTSVTSKERRGGYRQLATVVRSFQNELDSHGSHDGSDDEESLHDDGRDHSNDIPIEEGSIMYATSGSMGDLNPDFMLQMYEALARGREVHAPASTPWHVLYHKMKCLWPSRETALTMNLMSLIGSARSMSRSHWKNHIPEMAKRLVFLDARPNPTSKGDLNAFPFAHCKCMYFASRDMSLVYVGSHNFSKSAWGLRGEMPKNVELGVVLATASPSRRKEWKSRLPCLLPAASETSPPSYIPASAHSGIREVLQERNLEQAMEMTKEWLTRNEENDNENTLLRETKSVSANDNKKESNIIKADVVDLCDSD